MTATTEVEAGEGGEARTSTVAAGTRLLAAAAGVLPCCAQRCDALEAEVVPSDAVGRALGGRGRVPSPPGWRSSAKCWRTQSLCFS